MCIMQKISVAQSYIKTSISNVVENTKAAPAALGTSLLAVGTDVFADVPASATAALTTAGEDVSTIGWAAFGVLVAAAAFKYLRRAL